jgi:hypothetical protein
MQTVAWMAFSDSTHFSDKFSYKILFIPSDGLKDTNCARFAQILQFSENRNRSRNVSHPQRDRPSG